jgi:hypothetical protein
MPDTTQQPYVIDARLLGDETHLGWTVTSLWTFLVSQEQRVGMTAGLWSECWVVSRLIGTHALNCSTNLNQVQFHAAAHTTPISIYMSTRLRVGCHYLISSWWQYQYTTPLHHAARVRGPGFWASPYVHRTRSTLRNKLWNDPRNCLENSCHHAWSLHGISGENTHLTSAALGSRLVKLNSGGV